MFVSLRTPMVFQVPEVMSSMAERMNALLTSATARDAALAFTVIVPAWERVHAWSALKRSPFLVRLVVIAADEHVFVDGAQHR